MALQRPITATSVPERQSSRGGKPTYRVQIRDAAGVVAHLTGRTARELERRAEERGVVLPPREQWRQLSATSRVK